MKKLSFSLVLLTAVIAGCSSDDDNDNNPVVEKPQNVYKIHDGNIVGVWKVSSNEYPFISFSEDNYYSAILDENTLDDGDYSIVGDTITIKNSFRGYNTRLVLLSKTDRELTFDVKYMGLDEHGQAEEKNSRMTFIKTAHDPCIRKNALLGKTFSTFSGVREGSYTYYTATTPNIMSYTVNSYQSGKLLASGTIHYVYLPTRLYYTMYRDGHLYRAAGIYAINEREVEIDDSGKISIKTIK